MSVKLKGMVESITAVGKVPNLYEVRFVGNPMKYQMWNTTDRTTRQVTWEVSSLLVGGEYEFDYDESYKMDKTKNPPVKVMPEVVYHNLKNAVPLQKGWTLSPQGPQNEAVFGAIQCPYCGATVKIEGYRA